MGKWLLGAGSTVLRKIYTYASEIVLLTITLFVALFYIELGISGGIHEKIQAVLALGFVPASVFWRRHPLLSAVVVLFLLYVWTFNWIAALPVNLGFSPYILLAGLSTYGVSRYQANGWVVAGVAFFALAYCVVSPLMWAPGISGIEYRSFEQAFSWILIQWLLISGVLQLGRAELKRRQNDELERRAREEAALNEFKAHQAQERMQISREIHDILAHSLTLIHVQATAGEFAEMSVDGDTSIKDGALRNIRKISSDALTEVRGVINSLRNDDLSASSTMVSGLADIGSQIGSFEQSGLIIDSDIPDEKELDQISRTVPLVTQLALRRIVGEALTNALRHQGERTHVKLKLSIDYEGNAILLSISSRSSGGRIKTFNGSGSGLIGMEERVRNLGGSITFMPGKDYFSVAVTVPIVLK
ncbi:sensor histidine kinase [Corynebacterium kozikiae]|uniref:sensor histidine kinase n=1 Tax=Corynebacterium kozikiae TaxID=2968469 RepID=UPI00211CDE0E|nr:histidine kinase [Corynebacterium sp. 76QC2CO]MCQ9344092.1 histidine kinase [Corynebacterium sp. 76QC2CO]